jgi:hypothetical protein
MVAAAAGRTFRRELLRDLGRGLGLAVLLLATRVVPAGAAEIDSLTHRDVPLADARRALERRLNAALERGVAAANARGDVCDEAVLYRELRHAFAWPFIGHSIAESLNEDETLDRRRVLRADSIYRDLRFFDAVSVHWKDLSAVVRVGDALMGVDKIGHFVVEGWDYFETAYLDEDGVAAAMKWGEGTEDTYFGRYTTGVRSHADLVANFEGMRFWRRVTGRGEDPLDAGWRARRPYVKCGRTLGVFGEKRWRLVGTLDLRDYVTPVFDEAVNCCSYRSPEITAMVARRTAELSESNGRDLSCPVDPDSCVHARERYGAWAPRLLHPACLAAERSERSWWRFWR